MSSEDEIFYRLRYGRAPGTRIIKEVHMDNSRPLGERAYIEYIITNIPEEK